MTKGGQLLNGRHYSLSPTTSSCCLSVLLPPSQVPGAAACMLAAQNTQNVWDGEEVGRLFVAAQGCSALCCFCLVFAAAIERVEGSTCCCKAASQLCCTGRRETSVVLCVVISFFVRHCSHTLCAWAGPVLPFVLCQHHCFIGSSHRGS